jgi:hypothetical protein
MRTPSLKAIKTFQIAAKHSSFAVAAMSSASRRRR